MNHKITIRPATVADAQDLLNIYAPYIRETAITYEYDVPSLAEFQNRISHTLEKYPYLVAVDEHNRILGYAYASPFITYYLLVIIHERYLTKLHIISPHNWILKAESLPLGNFGAIILILEITAVLSALFWVVGERRLKRL